MPFPDSKTIHLSLLCSFTHSIQLSIKKKIKRQVKKKKTRKKRVPYQKIKQSTKPDSEMVQVLS